MKTRLQPRRLSRFVLLTCLLSLTALVPLGGCKSNGQEQANRSAASSKTYPLKGVIVSTDPKRGEVQINSEAIPGFMEAMVMPYKLKDPMIMQDLHPGDHLTANLLVTDTGAVLDQIVITQQAKPDYKPSAQYHVPSPGDLVPDFHFQNQAGKQIHLDQFRGKALLVTFIYTRCPLSDYCPRMSRNFAQIDRLLQSDPQAYAKSHLLSVSFDPAYDSPAVLRSYGSAYTGKYKEETFSHWDFAAPSQAELSKVLRYFDVGATPEQNKTITHSLSTVLIGPDGKVAAWYPTNDWNVPDVVAAIKQAEGKRGA